MKAKSWFFPIILLILTGLSVCTKDEPTSMVEVSKAKTAEDADSTGVDSTGSGLTKTGPNEVPKITASVFTPSISCTGVIIRYDINYIGGVQVGISTVCWDTAAYPTTANSIVRETGVNGPGIGFSITEGINGSLCFTEGRNGMFQSDIDRLTPATLYHVRACLITTSGTYYSEDISFFTNPRPVITTSDVREITETTAKVGGNIISAGNSFVIERGICYSMTPTTVPVPYGDNPYIVQEVQYFNASGEFTITLTNLTPGTHYYVRSFVGVMTGIEYGDELFEYGNLVHFTTK